MFKCFCLVHWISVMPLIQLLVCVRVNLMGLAVHFGHLQEPGRADWPVCGRLPSSRPTKGRNRGGRSSAAKLCRPVCLLQEVHGAVLPAEHWRAYDRPHNHLPKILERVCLEDSLWKPAQVRTAPSQVSTLSHAVMRVAQATMEVLYHVL